MFEFIGLSLLVIDTLQIVSRLMDLLYISSDFHVIEQWIMFRLGDAF